MATKTFDPLAFMRDAAMTDLKHFMGPMQRRVVLDALRGEEGEYFVAKMVELAALIAAMPKTYEQDGVADPIVHLHYFIGSMDWWITEKDMGNGDDSEGQIQAFGAANLGHGWDNSMGYISIEEITQHGAELDFHFKPRPLSAVRRA